MYFDQMPSPPPFFQLPSIPNQFSLHALFLKTTDEPGEMALWFRALVVLAWDLGLILRTHMVAHNDPYLQFQGIQCLRFVLHRHHTHKLYT